MTNLVTSHSPARRGSQGTVLRRSLRTFKALSALIACVNLPSHVSAAEDAPPGERAPRVGADRWIPSLAVDAGIAVQEWQGDVSSQVCRGCSLSDPMGMAEVLRPPASGDDRDQTPFVGISLDLMSPELSLPGSPRVFFGGEIAPTFGADRKLAVDGEIGPLGTRAADPARQSFSEDLAAGQGSEVVLQRDDVTFGAHLGLAFPFELFGRSLWIKPSVGWTRFEIDLQGQVADADCLPVTRGSFQTTECNPNDLGMGQGGQQFGLGFLRETRLFARESRTFDGIGPGLHLELDAGPAGPFRTSVFVGARAYRVLGNKVMSVRTGPNPIFDEINVSEGRGPDEVAARFGFEVDEWVYRAGIGVRLQWLGWDR